VRIFSFFLRPGTNPADFRDDHRVARSYLTPQRRLTWRWFREIRDVVDDRLPAGEARLIDELIHPCAAALVVALEVIEVEESER